MQIHTHTHTVLQPISLSREIRNACFPYRLTYPWVSLIVEDYTMFACYCCLKNGVVCVCVCVYVCLHASGKCVIVCACACNSTREVCNAVGTADPGLCLQSVIVASNEGKLDNYMGCEAKNLSFWHICKLNTHIQADTHTHTHTHTL